jgi:hypothetical protein
MKKVLQTLSLIGIASLLFFSCTKEYTPHDTEERNPFIGSFTANIWGSEKFEADVKYVKDTVINDVRAISFTATQFLSFADTNFFRTLVVSVANFTAPDTYPINMYSTYNELVLSYDSVTQLRYLQDNNDFEGFVIITKADRYKGYEGSFQFNTKSAISGDTSTVPVTNGQFKLEW